MADFSLVQVKTHALAIGKALANLQAEAERIGDPALSVTVDALHSHLAVARQAVANGFRLPATSIAPDGGVKPPSAS